MANMTLEPESKSIYLEYVGTIIASDCLCHVLMTTEVSDTNHNLGLKGKCHRMACTSNSSYNVSFRWFFCSMIAYVM